MQPGDETERISICCRIPRRLISSPSPRDWGVTELTPAIIYVEFANFITDSPNQNLLAVVAIGIVCIMTRDIPKVDIMNPLLEGYIPQKFQGFHWGCELKCDT
jgi:hypothetical protein